MAPAFAAPRERNRAFVIHPQTSVLKGSPGETLSLRGTLRNGLQKRVWVSGSRIHVRGKALRVDPDGVLQATTTPLPAGRSSRLMSLASLSVRLDADPGNYEGVLVVLGGKRRGDQDVLAQLPFQVTVR
jgi:hypothetical protein